MSKFEFSCTYSRMCFLWQKYQGVDGVHGIQDDLKAQNLAEPDLETDKIAQLSFTTLTNCSSTFKHHINLRSIDHYANRQNCVWLVEIFHSEQSYGIGFADVNFESSIEIVSWLSSAKWCRLLAYEQWNSGNLYNLVQSTVVMVTPKTSQESDFRCAFRNDNAILILDTCNIIHHEKNHWQ